MTRNERRIIFYPYFAGVLSAATYPLVRLAQEDNAPGWVTVVTMAAVAAAASSMVWYAVDLTREAADPDEARQRAYDELDDADARRARANDLWLEIERQNLNNWIADNHRAYTERAEGKHLAALRATEPPAEGSES